MTIPVTMPIVARPRPTGSRSATPYSTRIGVRPASVPCPPANDISMSAPALSVKPNTGPSTSSARMPPTANCPADMMPAMITCEPEIPQIALSGGNRSPSSNAAHMTLMSRPGRTLHTANVVSEKRPFPPSRRPRPSGPRPSMMNPPMTAVGMNSARSGRAQRRINAAPANTSDRITNDRPMSSALAGMTVSPARKRPLRCAAQLVLPLAPWSPWADLVVARYEEGLAPARRVAAVHASRIRTRPGPILRPTARATPPAGRAWARATQTSSRPLRLQWLTGLFGKATITHKPTDSIFALLGSFIVFTATFALLFKFLPPVQLRWRHVWLAAVLCATAWIVSTEMLALYGAYFGSLTIPGVLGALLAMTVWLNLVSQVVFYGAELCKVIARREGQSVRARDVKAAGDVSRSAVSIWRRRTPSR